MLTPGRSLPVQTEPAIRLLNDQTRHELQDQRQGIWGINEYWNSGNLLFHHQNYLRELRETPAEEFVKFDLPSWLYVTRFRESTIELTRRNEQDTPRWIEWTLAVYAARFDLEGLGTVDLLPVEVNDELPEKLASIDDGQARKGIYHVNGKQMTIFIPASPQAPRPTEIPQTPKTILPGEVLLILERRRPGSIVAEKNNMNYEFTPAESDYVLPAGTTLLQHIGALTEPVEFEYPKVKEKHVFVYRKPNGWIVQTDLPEQHRTIYPKIVNGTGFLRLKPDFEPLRPGEQPSLPY